mgnify:CR=1 FL=1
MLHQNDFCICDECNKSNLMYIEKENVMNKCLSCSAEDVKLFDHDTCKECLEYEAEKAYLNLLYDADPDGHYPVYCEICDEVDCSNPNHN